ncbi:MAG TPA: NAD-binding protein [Acetobacteraceae bacterium]
MAAGGAGNSLAKAERSPGYRQPHGAAPPFPGLADIPLIAAENWIALRELPPQLIFLGGSYIALEMAQALQRLGSQVTIVQKADRLAARQDPDVGDVLRQFLERDGCRVRLPPATFVAALRLPIPLTTTIGCWNRSCSATARVSRSGNGQ